MEQQRVACDKCKKEFEVERQVEKINDDLDRIYFVCPHCQAEYTYYYIDSDIRAKQVRGATLQCNYIKAVKEKDMKQADKLFDMIYKLAEEIKYDMERLKQKYSQH